MNATTFSTEFIALGTKVQWTHDREGNLFLHHDQWFEQASESGDGWAYSAESWNECIRGESGAKLREIVKQVLTGVMPPLPEGYTGGNFGPGIAATGQYFYTCIRGGDVVHGENVHYYPLPLAVREMKAGTAPRWLRRAMKRLMDELEITDISQALIIERQEVELVAPPKEGGYVDLVETGGKAKTEMMADKVFVPFEDLK